MNNNKKPDTLAVIDNYKLLHGDAMTNPAQRAESVKNVNGQNK